MTLDTRKWLILDIGSNSVIGMLCEASASNASILWEMRRITGLGKGLTPNAQIGHDAQKRTLSAIDEIGSKASLTGPYSCFPIGTEALRRAANAGVFAAALKAQTNAELRILSPDEELQYERSAFKLSSAGQALLGKSALCLIDLGGASCELTAIDTAQATRYAHSFSLGLIKLQACLEGCLKMGKNEAFGAIQSLIRGALCVNFNGPLGDDPTFQPTESVFSGSLPLAFAQLLTERDHFDPEAIEGLTCSAKQIDDYCRTAPWPPAEEQKLALLAALSMRELLAPTVQRLHFSTKGIRHGLLLELVAKHAF